jgi:hypothetical protein
MSKWKMKNGTPVGSESMCDTCRSALILRGYRDTETIVYCTFSYENMFAVPFKVRDCSGYCDKTTPTRYEMEGMALIINEATSAKSAGFRKSSDEREVAAVGFRKDE